ncbi:MAG: helix-turn-helix domain-containing protein, partial [Oscillospiraceae bacterium]|nr:helix-turn-helix domain-containing protein [Oscillospiraceae bacterium]
MYITKSRYYLKILLQLLVVVLVPLLIIGLTLGTQLFSSLAQKASQIEYLALSQAALKTEEQLRGVQLSVLQFCSQQDTMRAMRMGAPEEDITLFSKLKTSSAALRQSYNSGLRIRGVTVASSRNKWIYDTESGYSQLEHIGEQPLIPDAQINQWMVEIEYAKNVYFELAPVDYVLVWNTQFLNFGVVSVRVDYEDFSANFDLYSPFSRIFIISQDGRIIYDDTQENINTDSRELAFYPHLTGDEGEFTFKTPDGLFKGIYLKSEELGWYYVSVREDAFSRKEFLGNMAATLIILFAVFIAALFFISLLSRRLYKPIYNLSHSLGDMDPDGGSGGGKAVNEVQAIETTVSKMIGDNHRLKEQVAGQRELMRELLIYQLFTGRLHSDRDREMLTAYNIHMDWKHKVLVGICPVTEPDTPSEPAEEVRFLEIIGLIKEYIPGNTLIAPVMIDRMIVFIMGANRHDFAHFAETSARKIYDAMAENLQVKAGMAVSACFDTIDDIAGAFDRIRQLLHYRGDVPGGIHFLERGASGVHYPNKTTESILDGIKSGDLPGALDALTVFLDDVFLHTKDAYQRQLYMIWLIGDILRLAPDYSTAIVNALSAPAHTDPVQTLLAISSLEDKKKWLLDHVVNPVANALHANDANKQLIVKRMLSFIKENSGPDNDIEACASALNYNSSYLRKVFKDVMGVSYSRYLSKSALEKAKDMLLTTNMPISAVAGELGYSNSQNFIRYFKGEYGMTPGQFRSRHE